MQAVVPCTASSALLLQPQQQLRAFRVSAAASLLKGAPPFSGHYRRCFVTQDPRSLLSCGPLRYFLAYAAQSSAQRERWLMQPIGDGDCKHLNEAVPLPEAFELSTDAAAVGRLPEKADIVIPVATVSGLHARLEKKNGTLYVTDLDSTNGTFINGKRIRPGALTAVPPGSRVTFGDEHLAAYKFNKFQEDVPPMQL